MAHSFIFTIVFSFFGNAVDVIYLSLALIMFHHFARKHLLVTYSIENATGLAALVLW